MSSNFPGLPQVAPYREATPLGLEHSRPAPAPTRREWVFSAALFCITILSTTFAGMFYALGNIGFISAARLAFLEPGLILHGLPFSIPLIMILLAHEIGHFGACRHYGVRCTPPYFIPAPISIAGTLGAFIKIKSPFQNRRALFDIGIAGPVTGFVFVLPALWIGISLSKIIPKNSLAGGGLVFGEPLIFRFFGGLALGYTPASQDMIAHPIAMAAWFGLLATSLNLLPIWQLDGGHIAYAIFGRAAQKRISVVAAVALMILSFLSWPMPSYFLFGLLLLILGARVGFYHPATLSDYEDLGTGRKFFGFVSMLIFILCFIPVPISLA